MSSYSEYLGRQQQRMQKVLDTRPHRDAGHQTEIVRRLAASGTQEQRRPAAACVQTLNAPSTRSPSTFSIAKGHTVQDTTRYSEYTAGQAVAQSSMPVNAKASQISVTCYSSTVVPELNDRLAADVQLSRIQAAKNTYQRGWNTAACCQVCGKPPAFKGGCACALTASQQAGLPTSVSRPEVPS